MTGEELIREIQEDYAEWLNEVPCPATFVAGILANRIVSLMDHMKFVERRLDAIERRLKYDSRL